MKRLILIFAVIIPVICSAQWSMIFKEFGGGITKVFTIDKDHACAIGCGGNYWRTTDGGDSWTQYPTGTDLCLFDVVFLDANHGYICGAGGTLLKTTDGVNWNPLNTNTTCDLRSLSFKDFSTGYISGLYGPFFPVGDSGIIIRTTDEGNSFSIQKYSAGIISISMKNADTCFAVANNIDKSQILRIVNGGNNFEAIKSVNWADGLFMSVLSFGDGTLYSFLKNFFMYKSINNGNTWDSVALNDFQIINHVSFPVKSFGFTAGYDPMPEFGRTCKTYDGGNTWQTDFYTLFMDDVSVVITPGHDTIGYASQANGYLFKLEILTSVKEKEQKSLNIFPSLFDDCLSIQVPGAKSISAELFTGDMKKILSVSDNSDKLFIEGLNKLPAGMYFVKVSIGNNNFIRKIIHI